jgi:hypothetical protein
MLVPSFDKLSDSGKVALANMAYSLGQIRLTKLKCMLAAIAASDFDKALKEIRTSLWAKRVDERAARLAEIVRNG